MSQLRRVERQRNRRALKRRRKLENAPASSAATRLLKGQRRRGTGSVA